MPNLTQLRLAARAIFNEALRAVDAADAVRRAVQIDGLTLKIVDSEVDLGANNPVYAIAIGKAAFAMASALDGVLGAGLTAGIVSGNNELTRRDHATRPLTQAILTPSRWSIFHGGHPEPNEQSLAAAKSCFDLLERADNERALVILLISGGGSAMIEWPVSDSVTLADLRTANKALIKCSASISEINAVRRAFSAVKSGRLAERAPHCDQVTLIVSDVPPGEERNVASGPTLAPPTNAPDAREVIARYNLRSQLPETILRAIDAEPKTSNLLDDLALLRRHFVLLDNQSALEAAAEAARRRGFIAEIATDISDQPIAEGCEALVNRLDQLRERNGSSAVSVCLISGGEFACPVRGEGIGGRNLETALRLAQSISSRVSKGKEFVALCTGTDGVDGNSPAAGATVDSTTMARARAIGIDPQDFLDRSDAYSFFIALGDAIATGPTGTNVRDVRILLTSG